MSTDPHQQDEPSFDRRSADIGIVCTHNAEIKPLLAKLDRGRKYTEDGAVFRGGFLDQAIRIAIVEAGSGFAKHRQVTQTLLQEHRPTWVFSVGFSSSLTDEIKSGDVCLANEICDEHGNTLPVKCSIPESKRIFVRKHVVADQHPQLESARRSLAESTVAGAVDSTSLAVAQACQATDSDKPLARFLSVRGIVGDFSETLSENVVRYVFEPSVSNKTTVFGKLKQRFKPDAELAPWLAATDATAINLNRFLLGVIRQVGEKLDKSSW